MKKLVSLFALLLILLPSCGLAYTEPMQIETTFTEAIGALIGVQNDYDWFVDEMAAHTLAGTLAMDMFTSCLTDEQARAFDVGNGYIGIYKDGCIKFYVPDTSSERFYIMIYDYETQTMKVGMDKGSQYRSMVMKVLAAKDALVYYKLDEKTLISVLSFLKPENFQ